jgi:hypothetical protein
MEEIMSLIDDFKEPCVLMEKTRTSDGEGGWNVEWAEGAEFLAAIVLNSSMEAKIAEAQGVTSLYTVTTEKNAVLSYHDVFKRKSDGQIFRVTSNGKDKQTPGVATFRFSQVNAEKWELTT